MLMLMTSYCEIEANIGCCGACRKNVEQNLSRIEGVASVIVLPELNKVMVQGDVKPELLLEEVRKTKKAARFMPPLPSLVKEIHLEAERPAMVLHDMKESGPFLEQAPRDDNDIDASKDDSATKDPSSSALSKAARGLRLVAGYYLSPWSTAHGSASRVAPDQEEQSEKNAVAAQSERVGVEINVMGLGGRISYRKDVSYA